MNSVGQIMGVRGGYAAKLETKQWKAFALAMRQTKGGFCECCKQSGKTLQIHHFAYDPQREPWEYEATEVALLCSECHGLLHHELTRFRRFVFCKMNPAAFRVLNGALTVGFDGHGPLTLAYAIASLVSTPGAVKRFADDWKP